MDVGDGDADTVGDGDADTVGDGDGDADTVGDAVLEKVPDRALLILARITVPSSTVLSAKVAKVVLAL